MSLISRITEEKKGNNIYSNINVVNKTNLYQKLNVNVTRSDTIISNVDDYYLSVIRFSIPTLALPLFTLDLTNHPMTVVTQYGGVNFSVDLVYDSFLGASLSGPPPNPLEFSIYTYQQFVNMINVAILAGYNHFFPGPAAPGDPGSAYMTYDPDSQLFSMNASDSYIIPPPLYSDPTKVSIFFNTTLFQYFNNLLVVRNDYFLAGLNQIIFQNSYNNLILTTNVTPGKPGVQMVQPYTTTAIMNNLTSIVLTSNNFPVSQESQNYITLGTIDTQNPFLNILTDFEINTGGQKNAGDTRGLIIYQPDVFRYIDMNGFDAIRNFTINIYAYYANLQRYVLLQLPPLFTMSMKLLFKKKSLNY